MPSITRGLTMLVISSMSCNSVAAGFSMQLFGGASPEPNKELRTVTRTMEDVLQSIRAMHEQSSCRKFASLNLLNDCVSFDGTNPEELRSTDHVLSDYQQIFAVRLTACSVEEAHQRMPSACLPVLNREQTQEASLHLPECRNAIFKSGPNHWTTFTAEKKNSAILCRAMRVEKDKDEALHLYKTLASLLGNVNEALGRHDADISNLFHDLHTNVSQFKGFLMRDVEVSREAMKQQAAATMQDFATIGHQLQELLAVLASSKQAVSDSYEDAQEQGIAFRNGMAQHWRSAAEKIAEDLAVAREQAEFRYQKSLEEVFNQFYNITGSVAEANAAINLFVGKVDLVNNNLDAPLQKIDHINEQLDIHGEKQQEQLRMAETINDSIGGALKTLTTIMAPLASLSSWSQAKVPAFFAWFCMAALVSFKAFYFLGGQPAACLACAAGILLASALMHFATPVQVAEKVINSHPDFFGGASGFLSPSLVLLVGICMGAVGHRIWRSNFPQRIALPIRDTYQTV